MSKDELNSLNFSKNDTFQNIQGTKSNRLYSGKANFFPQKIFSKPNSEVFFKATSSIITRYYGEFFVQHLKNFSDFNFNQNYLYIFSIMFRECIVGEIFITQINRLVVLSLIIFFFYI